MKKGVLHKYVTLRLSSVEKQVKAFDKDKNPERLHRLRVEIKKIRAVFSFSKKVLDEKINSESLLPLFRKAGKIREIKMHIKLLEKIPELPLTLIAKFKNREAVLEEQFTKNIQGYLRSIKKYHKKISLPGELPGKKRIVKYFGRELKTANKVFRKKKREGVHSYRKGIKKLMYLYNALPGKLQKGIEVNTIELDRKQKQIGEWHDMYTALVFLTGKESIEQIREYVIKLKIAEEAKFRYLYNT